MYRDSNTTWNTRWNVEGAGRCVRPPQREREQENDININTNLTINQTAYSGPGGHGGNGGSAQSEDAEGGAAAYSNGLIGISVAANEIETDLEFPIGDALRSTGIGENSESLRNGEGMGQSSVGSRPSQGDERTGASGGEGKSIANGGNGGHGGNSGPAINSATVYLDNIIIISGDEPGRVYRLGMNDRNLDFKVDENGDTFVNGKKMDSEALEDGTRVYIFKNKTEKNTKS